MKVILLSLFLLMSISDPYRYSGQTKLNNLQLTPGAIRTTEKSEICDASFRTGKYRHTTELEKKKVCQEYGASDCPNFKLGEVDHLVPLFLGGADELSNLWWQPAPDFRKKDLVEVWTHKQVCSGNMELVDAQRQMISDWTVLYGKMVKSK